MNRSLTALHYAYTPRNATSYCIIMLYYYVYIFQELLHLYLSCILYSINPFTVGHRVAHGPTAYYYWRRRRRDRM